LANDIGGDGKTGSKRGFGGFRGARRLHWTAQAVDYVTEAEEVAQGNMPWNPDRRHHHRFEAVALPHLDAAYALARCLTRNDADAADVVQEAYLRAFRYFDSYRERDAKSWLLQIVRRTWYTWFERNRPGMSSHSEPSRSSATWSRRLRAMPKGCWKTGPICGIWTS
jgi:hypothetical protein